MRRPSSVLLGSTAAAVAVVLVGASAAQVSAGSRPGPQASVSLLAGGPSEAPQAKPSTAPDPARELRARIKSGTVEAQRRGADISFSMIDRQTGVLITSGNTAQFPTASVAKLFIADDLLTRAAQRKVKLNPRDRRALDTMLRSSADFPAEDFWNRGGGNAIVKRVAARYTLTSTVPPYDGNWWNTMSTTADLVRYYDKLLDGSGGLPREQTDLMLADLTASTPVATDGYPQRFGLPDGLFAERVAVKQGWMCCWGPNNQVHLTTGVAGPDRRYVIAMVSMQPVDEVVARSTMTETLKTMFPGGHI
jgi:hypothetical protein